MALFHVYVEGPTDPSPDAHKRLAEIMASRYGLPLADVQTRLAKGRFRVKANVDRATADVYLRDLGAVGAKVVIEAAGPRTSPSLPIPNAPARPITNPPFASGLAAAFETKGAQDLGVLGGDSGSFALSSVDGNDNDSSDRVDSSLPASFAPPPVAAAAAPKPRPSAPKLAPAQQSDMFAPPDAEDENQKVELHADEIAHQARKRASTPPASVPIVAPLPGSPVLKRKLSSTQTPPITALAPRGRLGVLSEPRNRFAAGVIVAILLGFVPTHLIATFREHDAYQKIDSKYLTDAASAPDPASWNALDEPALRDKKSAQRDIALTSLILWALFAGGIGYVWFKRVPWTGAP